MLISRVILGAGNSRRVAELSPRKFDRIEAAKQLKRFLFPDNGSFHKAKRRGERALALAGGAL